MRRPSSFLTLVAGLVIAIASTACDELSAFVPPETVALTTSNDPAVKAAGDSSVATDKIHEADAELNKGLETKDTSHLDAAVKLRPLDPSYYYYKAALQLAEQGYTVERNIRLELNKAAGIQGKKYDGSGLTADEIWNRVRLDHGLAMVDAFAVTKTHYTRGTEQWERLNYIYCVWLKDIIARGAALTASFYSDDDCP